MPLLVDSGGSAWAPEFGAADCIRVGLINNMPDAAVAATERQFTDLLRAAAPDAMVHVSLFAIPEMPRGDGVRRELARR